MEPIPHHRAVRRRYIENYEVNFMLYKRLTRVLMLGLLSLAALAHTAAEAAKPNIIYIMADDLGYGDLGCYGQKVLQTPNIDRLANEGMKFTQHYAGSTVCAPSRCALMTGLHTGHCYIRGNRRVNLRPADVTVAELLQQEGYTTGLAGKWGLGIEGEEGVPNRQGFDFFFGYLDQGHAHNYYPTFLIRNEERVHLKNVVPNPKPSGAGKASEKIEYSHDLIVNEGLDFIRRNHDKPFFLYYALTIPHANNEAREEGMEVPDHGPYADKDWPEPKKGMAAMVTRMDGDIGRLMALLKELEIDDNTLVIFTSDNGPHKEGGNDPEWFDSNGPLRGIKRDLYDGGIRVPFIAHWPGKVAPGTTSDHISAFWDFLPTAVEVAGGKAPEGLDGISYLPTITGNGAKQEIHDHLYWEFTERGGRQGIREGDWKGIRLDVFKNPDAPMELYNVKEDLGEMKNVAKKHPDVVARLAKKIDAAHTSSTVFPLTAAERKKSQEVQKAKNKSAANKPKPKPKRNPIVKWGSDEVFCFALYTVQDKTLKLTAQLYPLKTDDRTVRLEVKDGSGWKKVATTTVVNPGWTAPFRVENWDTTRDFQYRVAYGKKHTYGGRIRRDPSDKNEIVVAAFTGNSNRDRGPRPDIIANVTAQDPDLLFFSGDQSYDHKNHYEAWLLFGQQFGEIIRDRPTIAIPDDHDVGQGNIWGAGGKVAKTPAGPDGGYFEPVEYVNEVQRAQTSHLPDPFDPTPIQRGITVYYTSLNVGGVDFAIIEDRKFKSGPEGLVPKQGPRPDHINDPNFDPMLADVEGAVLLGERQLHFLDTWAQDWEGAEMKTVLSQTIFANGAHIHGKIDARLIADLDSNGWPQTGRRKAIEAIRKGYANMVAGDQHLATVIHHGTNVWNDSGYSFCVPSIVNFYGRWWSPLEPGKNRAEGPLPHTGEFLDGLHNKITMYAYANPTEDNFKAAGYGLVRYDKSARTITMECWPRHVDVTQADAKQHPGWPITISQEDNYAREAAAWLPAVTGNADRKPVIQVIDEETRAVVYTLRVKGLPWQPKVFAEGKYTLRISEGSHEKTVKGLIAVKNRARAQQVPLTW
jgi:arylsulfatase A-like enzyme